MKKIDMWETERRTKREEVTKCWRKLHNLYLLPNNSLKNKRRTTRRDENMTHMKENKKKKAHGHWWENLREWDKITNLLLEIPVSSSMFWKPNSHFMRVYTPVLHNVVSCARAINRNCRPSFVTPARLCFEDTQCTEEEEVAAIVGVYRICTSESRDGHLRLQWRENNYTRETSA
jgi:hypothetical protein